MVPRSDGPEQAEPEPDSESSEPPPAAAEPTPSAPGRTDNGRDGPSSGEEPDRAGVDPDDPDAVVVSRSEELPPSEPPPASRGEPAPSPAFRPRLTLTSTFSAGFAFDGGHFETRGIDPSGNVITVPTHRHKVSLNVFRFELEGRLDVSREWSVALRVPVDVRAQDASIETVDPATQAEYEAMLRNRDLHHRDATYAGISDLALLGSYRFTGVGGPRGVLRLALGVGLPVGATEDDPYAAGDAGEQHLHIQFGSGTFVPLLEASLTLPVADEFLFSVFAAGRLPVYENSHGFRAPPELFAGVRGSWQALPELTVGAGSVLVLQGYGAWDGERDVNTGFLGVSAVVGVQWRVDATGSLRLDVLIPLLQDTLTSNSEAFTQGPMIVFATSAAFHP